MIKINLLGESTGKSSAFTYGLIGYAVSVVLCLALFSMLYQQITNAVSDKEEEIQRLSSQLAALQEQTKKVDELEKKKPLLNSTLALIARLRKSKIGPVRVMDDLNLSVPARIWLRSVQEKGGVVQIKGRAFSNQDIAQFLKSLDASDYFDQVELVHSVQMYYSKRTGKVSPTPDLQSLRGASPNFGAESRVTKESTMKAGGKEGGKAKKWSVKQSPVKGNERRSAVDEFNVKIKEFLVTARVNYAGKLKLEAAKAAAPAQAAVRS